MIAAGSESMLNRVVLSNSVAVFIGKISYSLYLWHWVFFSLARIIEGDAANRNFRWIIIFVSILFAWISTRFLETPIRSRKNSRSTALALMIGMVVIGLSGLTIYLSSGFPFRDSGIQQVLYKGDMDHDVYHRYHIDHFPLCTPLKLRNEAPRYNGMVRCFQSKADVPVEIALVGDSHAEHLFLGLAEMMKDRNLVYYIKEALPLDGQPEFSDIFSEVLSNPKIKKILISAFWANKKLPLEAISQTTQIIGKLIDAKKQVFIFDDIPDFDFMPVRCKIQRIFRNTSNCSMGLKEYEVKRSIIHEKLQALKKEHPALQLVFSSQYFCSLDTCSMTNGSELLYRDYMHLNMLGSRFLAKHLLADYPELSD